MPAESTGHAPSLKQERQHSLWQSPDGSVSIYLTFEVIDAINLALSEMAHAAPVRGAEIGGLLLGKSERRARLTVWVDRFEPIPCSYPRGPSWLLNEAEQKDLVDRLADQRGAEIVGFFRSHTRKDLFLTEDDAALFTRMFADPSNVFLLVKPFTTRPNVAGFFHWENGVIPRTGSRLEFPFHRRELGGGEPVAIVAPPPQAWVRAEDSAPDEGPMFLRQSDKKVVTQRSLFRKFAYVLGSMTLAVAGYAAYTRLGPYHPQRLSSQPSAVAPAIVTERREGTLRLLAAEGEKNIVLTWDTASPVAAAATKGSVEITEGSFHKTLEMSTEDLRAGRLVYSRPDAVSDTVLFRMQVSTGQGDPFSESVRFVSRGPMSPTPRPATVRVRPVLPAIAETLPPPPEGIAPAVVVPKPEAIKITRPAPRREP